MNKVVAQGLVIIVLFVAIWFSLSNVNWLSIFNVETNTNKLEKELGDYVWKIFNYSEESLEVEIVTDAVESIVSKICDANQIERDNIKIHLFKNSEINAFALPDGHLVIYSGLIKYSDTADELAGVICHELAHIELNHVMKKMIKEMGLSVLVSVAAGGGNSNIGSEMVKLLSSSAFDRSLEKEADLQAVEYMKEANINPEALATFFYKLSENKSQFSKYLFWASTHPELKDRYTYIVDQIGVNEQLYESILSDEMWQSVQDVLR